MDHPVPTKVFLQSSPYVVMLFSPCRCTHPSPPILPFLLKQNFSKGHCRKRRKEAKSLTMPYEVIGEERVKGQLSTVVPLGLEN